MASPEDMARFKAEGFALVGASAVAAKLSKPGKPGASPLTAAKAVAAAAGAPTDLQVVRVNPGDGLVYARPISFDDLGLGPGGEPLTPGAQSVAGSAPTASRTQANSRDRTAAPPAALDNSLGPDAALGAQASEAGGRRLKAISRRDWFEIRARQPYPWTAIGSLRLLGERGSEWACSGSLIGDSSVLTAAHCVYDRWAGTTVDTAYFAPHRFYSRRRQMETPFGEAASVSYDFLTGFQEVGNDTLAFLHDNAVIQVNASFAAKAGRLGFEYRPEGYTGRIFTGGYPGLTVRPWGRFYRFAGACSIADADGTDSQLRMQQPGQKRCLSRCAIAEGGQSGQPAFVQTTGGGYAVLATLSYGPATGTCFGYDTYCQLSSAAFGWLKQYVP